MRLRTSDAPDGEGGNKWAADSYCPDSRRGPGVPRAGGRFLFYQWLRFSVLQRTNLDGIEFKQTAYALDRGSRKAALARFLSKAAAGDDEETEVERRLAA
jgi:hypothetical protein